MNQLTGDIGTAATSISRPRTLLFLAYPQIGLLDLTGAQTVFWAASKAMAERGMPGYELHTASLEGGLMQTAEGLAVHTSALSLFDNTAIDTLIVPGAPDIRRAMLNGVELVDWRPNPGQSRGDVPSRGRATDARRLPAQHRPDRPIVRFW